jgi:hypothetical protein
MNTRNNMLTQYNDEFIRLHKAINEFNEALHKVDVRTNSKEQEAILFAMNETVKNAFELFRWLKNATPEHSYTCSNCFETITAKVYPYKGDTFCEECYEAKKQGVI